MVEFTPIRLAPTPKARVWGGDGLGHGPGIGEAWVIHEESLVVSGRFAGESLGAIVARHATEVLGTRGRVAADGRFPLLIKLLDARDWLSIQVHPDDRLAIALEGVGAVGKAEAWHVLAAEPGARMISGLRPGLSPDAFAAVVDRGELLEWVRFLEAVPGDTIYNRPGLIHALGPGITLYEVQQNSDVTYRVWDWNRPPSAARKLHVAQSRAAAVLDAAPAITPGSSAGVNGSLLTRCAHFTLTQIGPGGAALDPGGERFHALTVVEGVAIVHGRGWCETLTRFESILVPASAGPYVVAGESVPYRALIATVP